MTRALYEIADAHGVTVGELTGERRRYSRIHVPESLRPLVGQDYIHIEHFDEGINANEVQFWKVFWEMKRKEEEREAQRKRGRR